MSLGVLLVLLVSVLADAWPVLSERGFGFVTGNLSDFESRAGVWQGLIGSLILIAFVAVIAVPLGVAAAIYLQEYARDTRATRSLITNIRNLAGVPSIVWGILGVVVFAQLLRGITGPDTQGLSYISGGLTLAVLVMPFLIIITMEALRAVPRGDPRGRLRRRRHPMGGGAEPRPPLRGAGGLHRDDPRARPRVRRDRADPPRRGRDRLSHAGRSGDGLIDTLQGKYTALPTIIYSWTRKPGEEWGALTAAAIVVLLAVILVVNLAAILLRNRYERKW